MQLSSLIYIAIIAIEMLHYGMHCRGSKYINFLNVKASCCSYRNAAALAKFEARQGLSMC